MPELNVQSQELSERIATRVERAMTFLDTLEADLFSEENLRRMGRREKLELHAAIKKSVEGDLSFALKAYAINKDMDAETRILVGIIQSMPQELRKAAIKALKEIIINREKYAEAPTEALGDAGIEEQEV